MDRDVFAGCRRVVTAILDIYFSESSLFFSVRMSSHARFAAPYNRLHSHTQTRDVVLVW